MNLDIEAVTVCVNYADFLAVAAERNRGLLDRWIVATEKDDTRTRSVCRRFDLETVLVSGIRSPKGFDKAKAINRALALTSQNGWHLHLDADIILPPDFRHCLNRAGLEEHKLYGCDRVTFHSDTEGLKFLSTWAGCHTEGYRVQIDQEPGVRISLPHDGYVPIGFFQLWHNSVEEFEAVRCRRYPEHHHTAARCDVQFALQWNREDRILLPELYVVHLESEAAPMGANWKGRTTKPFGLVGALPIHDEYH